MRSAAAAAAVSSAALAALAASSLRFTGGGGSAFLGAAFGFVSGGLTGLAAVSAFEVGSAFVERGVAFVFDGSLRALSTLSNLATLRALSGLAVPRGLGWRVELLPLSPDVAPLAAATPVASGGAFAGLLADAGGGLGAIGKRALGAVGPGLRFSRERPRSWSKNASTWQLRSKLIE